MSGDTGTVGLPERILLVDTWPLMVAAWRDCFADDPRVEIHEGDYFSRSADAMVSPANSAGIMDGGLDQEIVDHLGKGVAREVRRMIRTRYGGELPVGAAAIVATGDERWPWLVVAPTMRVPEDVHGTANAYRAFRAILLAVRAHNMARPAAPIRSLLCPGLGTGIGNMDAEESSGQMRRALRQFSAPPE